MFSGEIREGRNGLSTGGTGGDGEKDTIVVASQSMERTFLVWFGT